MNVIKTQWPEVKTYLATELTNDLYIRQHLGGQIYVCGQREVQNVMNVTKAYESPNGLRVWLEAQDDDARALLRSLPVDKELFVSLGTPLGLKLVQEELTGVVKVLSLFCMINQHRFQSAHIHYVSKLGRDDNNALQRYPASPNRDVFFRMFDEGKVNLYGSYEKGEIVGYAAVFPGDMVNWVHVRPEFRGQGYGRSLLSNCTMDLLKKHEIVFYDACMEDMANLRMCLAVGFAPLRQTFFFEGKRNDK